MVSSGGGSGSGGSCEVGSSTSDLISSSSLMVSRLKTAAAGEGARATAAPVEAGASADDARCCAMVWEGQGAREDEDEDEE